MSTACYRSARYRRTFTACLLEWIGCMVSLVFPIAHGRMVASPSFCPCLQLRVPHSSQHSHPDPRPSVADGDAILSFRLSPAAHLHAFRTPVAGRAVRSADPRHHGRDAALPSHGGVSLLASLQTLDGPVGLGQRCDPLRRARRVRRARSAKARFEEGPCDPYSLLWLAVRVHKHVSEQVSIGRRAAVIRGPVVVEAP